MSQQRIVHPEWRDYHDPTKYPFADTATLVNTEEDQNFIPEGVFLDAAIYPIGGGNRMYLSKVVVTTESATIYIGDETQTELASGEIDLVNPQDNIALADSYGRPAGLLVSEASRLIAFQGWAVGTHTFRPDQTEFAARVCFPTPEIGVRGFLLEDGSVLTGDVWLVGDDGVVLSSRQDVEPDPDNPTATRPVTVIRIDVVGDPLFRRRLCGDLFQSAVYLRSITARQDCREVVCEADSEGNIHIGVGKQDAVDSILRIRATAEGLIFETVGERQEGIR